jgi:hypothetical protein
VVEEKLMGGQGGKKSWVRNLTLVWSGSIIIVFQDTVGARWMPAMPLERVAVRKEISAVATKVDLERVHLLGFTGA